MKGATLTTGDEPQWGRGEDEIHNPGRHEEGGFCPVIAPDCRTVSRIVGKE